MPCAAPATSAATYKPPLVIRVDKADMAASRNVPVSRVGRIKGGPEDDVVDVWRVCGILLSVAGADFKGR